MATYTEHYNLIKPALNDKVNINNLNDNADIIDTALNNKVDTDETRNITTSAANCMLSDGVTSVEDALTANSLGTRVEITSYTEANPFTAPSDGYAVVYLRAGDTGYLCVESGSCAIGGSYYDTDSAHEARHGIYVRKGMRLFCTLAPHYAAFIPIVKETTP